MRDPERGDVYYSDLGHVWRIRPSGSRSVAVADVHTHELRLDRDGNLEGEDLEFLGDDRWRHRIWRLTTDGRLVDVFPWRDGFRDDYGFVADAAGALYWASCAEREARCVVKRRLGDHVTIAAGGARFERPLNFLAEDGRGGVLLADGRNVLRITADEEPATIAAELSRAKGRFALMGVHAASDGILYVAAYEDREVVRVDPSGARGVVARSAAPWRPTAALAAPEALWVLEFDGARAQVRRLDPQGGVRVYGDGN